MAIDASTYCPGGTGKKIKHCACRDISGELQTIMRALEGNQRIAAIDRINRLLATNANRPCLLSLKIMTLMGMNELQNLEETVTTFVQVAPQNPLAHTYAALLEARKERTKAAVDSLQTAIECSDDTMPGELYDALGVVAHSLATQNRYMAARGHLFFRALIGGDNEDGPKQLLAISSARKVPTLLKRDLQFQVAPDGVSWQAEANSEVRQGDGGAWRRALGAFEKLNNQYPGQAVLLHNIAVAQTYLGSSKSAVAWHDYAMADSVDFDAAVMAEATHQLLEYEATRKTVGLLKVTADIADMDALQERLQASPQVLVSPAPPDASQGSEDGPPPKAVMQLLDRPDLAEDVTPTLDNLPSVVAQALLYGKETDREARIELVVPQGERLAAARAILTEAGGDLITLEGANEEVLDAVPIDSIELFPNLHFPAEANWTDRMRLANEAIAKTFMEKWAQLPLAGLDNKTPHEVKDDPDYAVRLAAALLVLEQISEVEGWPTDADGLRDQLGVAVPAAIDPTSDGVLQMHPHQWRRVEVEKLNDEQLENFYRQAAIFDARTATQKLGTELLKRGVETTPGNLAEVAGRLAELSSDGDKSLEYLRQARQLTEKAGSSPARWYLAELPLRMLRGEASEAQHIMTVLQTRHLQEPGISESLFRILVQFGIVTPDGRPAGGQMPAGGPEGPAAAGASDQQLWTPDSGAPAAGPAKESKLWVPGMD